MVQHRQNRLKIALIFLFIIISFLNAEQVEVTANSFFADEVKQVSVLEGNVVIKKGSYDTLTSDKLTINFDTNRQPTKYIATGNAKFKAMLKDKHYRGKGDELVYDPTSSTYVLTGNAYLTEEESKKEVFGHKIRVDQRKGTYSVNSGAKDKKPARLIFQIEEKK